MDRKDIKIRSSLPQDVAGIFELVEELAVYEKARHEMWLTLEDYINFYEQKSFESIVAVDHDEKVIGTCIFYDTFSTWKGKMLYLEDFVVREAYRRTGVGQLLFDHFVQMARDRGCALVKWQVLDWNDPAIQFYKKNKAIIESEWWSGKIIFERKSI